jgi:predicted acetyltransferase
MATSYLIRPITQDELDPFLLVDQHAFNESGPTQRSSANFLDRVEFDRTLAAFDGTTPVGGTGIFTFQMRVPGAMAPVAGVSLVSVLPTYRRRGILSALMHRQLADVSERGEPLAALFASETPIYGRYGYGAASWHASYSLRGREGALAPGAPTDSGLRLRITDPVTARAELAKVYDQALAERPGLYARTDPWWDRILTDLHGEPPQPVRCLLAEDDSGPRGYALYTTKGRWDEDAFLPDGVLDVSESVATDPAATAALWGDLLSRDLVNEFHARLRPVDDPLYYLLADPRRARPLLGDGLWVRVIDVGAALALRRYSCPVDVVIEVTDGLLPANQGRWRLTASDGAGQPGYGATCEPTAAPADVKLPVRALGAAYLGGTRLGPLAGAGLITEVRAGSLAALSTAMSWEPAPWCPMVF